MINGKGKLKDLTREENVSLDRTLLSMEVVRTSRCYAVSLNKQSINRVNIKLIVF